MNQEILKFIPAETGMTYPVDEAHAVSSIHVVGAEVWLARICVYGYRPDDAEALRDRVLWALRVPTVPELWQWQDEAGNWHNLAHGGEAALKKGQGLEIRALYLKPPLEEV